MTNAVEAVVEIFTWVGFGIGALFAGIALLAYLIDGTWAPARAVVERIDGHIVLRWFDGDGGVNQATLHPMHAHEVGERDMVDIWIRVGAPNRMRMQRRSPAVRTFTTLAGVLLGVGLAAMIVSWILLFARG